MNQIDSVNTIGPRKLQEISCYLLNFIIQHPLKILESFELIFWIDVLEYCELLHDSAQSPS